MSKLEDAVRNSEKIVLGETSNSSNWRATEAKLKADRENVQLQSAEDLHKLLEQLEEIEKKREEDKREQAKENRISRIYNLVALLVAIASMIIALVK